MVEECNAHLERGKEYLNVHNCEQGIPELRKAIEKSTTALGLAPGDAEACRCRGLSFLYLEDLDKAIPDLECALEGLEGEKKAKVEKELGELKRRVETQTSVSMGPVTFGKGLTKDGQLIGPGTELPADTLKEIHARWDLYNADSELTTVKWFFNNVMECYHFSQLEPNQNWDGTMFFPDEVEYLQSGTWGVEVWFGNRKITEGRCTVTEQAAAPPTSASPTIISIDFPSPIPADGTGIDGRVRFKDPDGDVNRVTFDVISASDFSGFEFNPVNYLIEGDATDGVFSFHTWSNVVQQVTLRVTLYDAARNSSAPVDFSFSCQ